MRLVALYFGALLVFSAAQVQAQTNPWTLSTFAGDGRMEFVQRGAGLVEGTQDMAGEFTFTFRLKGKAFCGRSIERMRLPTAIRFDVFREAGTNFFIQFFCTGDSTFLLGGRTRLTPYWAAPLAFLGLPSQVWETKECKFGDSTGVMVDSLVIFFEFPFKGDYELLVDNITFVYGDSLVLIDSMGDSIMGVDSGVAAPEGYSLHQNYPNPFNPETTIKYQLPVADHVRLSIYTVLGQEVRRLIDRSQAAAYHVVVWDGRDNAGKSLPSGVYFYRLESGSFTAMKKMILMK